MTVARGKSKDGGPYAHNGDRVQDGVVIGTEPNRKGIGAVEQAVVPGAALAMESCIREASARISSRVLLAEASPNYLLCTYLTK